MKPTKRYPVTIFEAAPDPAQILSFEIISVFNTILS